MVGKKALPIQMGLVMLYNGFNTVQHRIKRRNKFFDLRNIIGTLMGVAVIASIDQLLRLFNVSIYLYNVFWGIVVLFTVCMDLLKKHEERREREMRLEEANENEIM